MSLAKVTLDLYRELDDKEQARFFAALLAEFSPDPAARARDIESVRRRAFGRQFGATEHSRRAAAPGAAPAAEPRARRHRRDPAHARTASGIETRPDASSMPSTGIFAICCRRGSIPASCKSFESTGTLPLTCWSRSSRTRRCTRFAGGTTFAAGCRQTVVALLLPPGTARRAADLSGGGADGPNGRLGPALARRPIHVERSRQGDHRRLLLDQQLPAWLARHIAG